MFSDLYISVWFEKLVYNLGSILVPNKKTESLTSNYIGAEPKPQADTDDHEMLDIMVRYCEKTWLKK